MKKLLSLLAFPLLLTGCAATNTTETPGEYSLESAQLSGPVKSVTTAGFLAGADSAGRVVRGAALPEGSRQVYSETGMLDESVSLHSGECAARFVYAYGRDNRIAEILRYGADGKMAVKMTFEWNAGHTEKICSIYDADGELTGRRVSVYDTEGHLLTETDYAADGAETGSLAQRWGNGRMIERALRQDSALISRIQNIRYDGDHMVAYDDYTEEQFPTGFFIAYDKFGHITKVEEEYDDGTRMLVREMEYTYDTHGNWTEQTVYTGPEREPDRILVRTIEYR